MCFCIHFHNSAAAHGANSVSRFPAVDLSLLQGKLLWLPDGNIYENRRAARIVQVFSKCLLGKELLAAKMCSHKGFSKFLCLFSVFHLWMWADTTHCDLYKLWVKKLKSTLQSDLAYVSPISLISVILINSPIDPNSLSHHYNHRQTRILWAFQLYS